MKKIIVYSHATNRWERLMNKLWFYTAEKNKLWAKLIYYPLSFIESKFIALQKIHHTYFHKNKYDCYWCQEDL